MRFLIKVSVCDDVDPKDTSKFFEEILEGLDGECPVNVESIEVEKFNEAY